MSRSWNWGNNDIYYTPSKWFQTYGNNQYPTRSNTSSTRSLEPYTYRIGPACTRRCLVTTIIILLLLLAAAVIAIIVIFALYGDLIKNGIPIQPTTTPAMTTTPQTACTVDEVAACAPSTCQFINGTAACDCDSGFEPKEDELGCKDINECIENTTICGADLCTNEPGSYDCECRTGYAPPEPGPGPCEDIDECDDGTSGCQQNCTNTDGGYECDCLEGYFLNPDEKTCTSQCLAGPPLDGVFCGRGPTHQDCPSSTHYCKIDAADRFAVCCEHLCPATAPVRNPLINATSGAEASCATEACPPGYGCEGTDPKVCCSLCAYGEIPCGDAACVNVSALCDGVKDCSDGKDEENCVVTYTCPEGLFNCGNGKCISESLRCDGNNNCADNSDEFNCTCGADKFQCDIGTCIDKRDVCDTVNDCGDGSDEKLCLGCGTGKFRCEDGTCLDGAKICDGVPDCSGGEDEDQECGDCAAGSFLCNNRLCIPYSRVCDGNDDCNDNSDEGRCGITAAICPIFGQFKCANGRCIEAAQKCDFSNDCGDGSDEEGCPACPADKFDCGNDLCVERTDVCDGVNQCEVGTDEATCEGSTVPGSMLPLATTGGNAAGAPCVFPFTLNGIAREWCITGAPGGATPWCGTTADVDADNIWGECQPDSGCEDYLFTCKNGKCLTSAKVCDRHNDCGDFSDEQCDCASDEFRCKNGLCIPIGFKCDGKDDCGDHTDEGISEFGPDDYDCKTVECTTGEFTCFNQVCVPNSQQCNGENNCGDYSDEKQSCPCDSATKFECDNKLCIDISRKCNGINDCNDNSDENNCAGVPVVDCAPDQYACGDLCLPKSPYLCDGTAQCVDGSDEDSCGTTP